MTRDKVFLCGYTPNRQKAVKELTQQEKKLMRNFSQFLRGRGHRCPGCLHKAEKHWVKCNARDCDCPLSSSDVIAVRAQTKCPNWEKDHD